MSCSDRQSHYLAIWLLHDWQIAIFLPFHHCFFLNRFHLYGLMKPSRHVDAFLQPLLSFKFLSQVLISLKSLSLFLDLSQYFFLFSQDDLVSLINVGCRMVELLVRFVNSRVNFLNLLDCRSVQIELLICVILPSLQLFQLFGLQQFLLENIVNLLLALDEGLNIAKCIFHLCFVLLQFVHLWFIHVEFSKVRFDSGKLAQVIS